MKKGVKRKKEHKKHKQNINNSYLFTPNEISELDKIVANLIISKLIKYYTPQELSETFKFFTNSKNEENPPILKELQLTMKSLINNVGIKYLSKKLFHHSEVEIKDSAKIGTFIDDKKCHKRGRKKKIKIENNIIFGSDINISNIVYRENPSTSFYNMVVTNIGNNFVAKIRCRDKRCGSFGEYKIKEKELILLYPHSIAYQLHSYIVALAYSNKDDYMNYMNHNLDVLAIEVVKQKRHKNIINKIDNFKITFKNGFNSSEFENKINFFQKKTKIFNVKTEDNNIKPINNTISTKKEISQITEKNNIITIENSEYTQNEVTINSDNSENETNKIKLIENNENNNLKSEQKQNEEKIIEEKASFNSNQSFEITNNDINLINNELNNPENTKNIFNGFIKSKSNGMKENIENKKEEGKQNEEQEENHINSLVKKTEVKNSDYEITIYDDYNLMDNDLKIINSVLYTRTNPNKKEENKKLNSLEDEIIEINDEDENNNLAKKGINYDSKNIYDNIKKSDIIIKNRVYTGRKRGRKKKIIDLNDEGDDDIRIVSKENKFMIEFGENTSYYSKKKLNINEKMHKNILNQNQYPIIKGKIFNIIKQPRKVKEEIRKINFNSINLDNYLDSKI